MAKKNLRTERIIENDDKHSGTKILPMKNNRLDMSQLEHLSDRLFNEMPIDERTKFELMTTLATLGVTPDEYQHFYQIYELSEVLAAKISSEYDSDDSLMPFDSDTDNDPMDLNMFRRRPADLKAYEPLADASERTLLIRIQMKGVTKPPMWREILIPADYNFMQLHEVIQAVAGLDDCHLWQFNRRAYDGGLTIGVQGDADEWGIEDATHDPEETSLTMFLQKKGDKLEYVYDFGDDWIFTVEVKDVINEKRQHPECVKFKCLLNAIDDFGGVYSYLTARQDLDEWSGISKREQSKRARSHGFDSSTEYIEYINRHMFSLDETNEALSYI